MKTKFLKLNKPCTENWEQMKPNEIGNFCDICSKTVIDFTQLNQHEIATKIKKGSGNICARVTQRQLNLPLLDFETQKNYNLSYSNIASGLLIATTLAIGQPLQAKNQQIQTEMVQTDTILHTKKNHFELKPNPPKPNDYTILKGKVSSEKDQMPIINSKITFVSVKKIISAYTSEDGTFSLKIPTELIDDDNVIRVSYNEIKVENNQQDHISYETTDYILTKDDINSIYKIIAKPEVFYLGGIGSITEIERFPIVINNGEDIGYKDFIRAQAGKKSKCNLENKDYLYFASQIAIAIYGKKAKYGLYILIDKSIK